MEYDGPERTLVHLGAEVSFDPKLTNIPQCS